MGESSKLTFLESTQQLPTLLKDTVNLLLEAADSEAEASAVRHSIWQGWQPALTNLRCLLVQLGLVRSHMIRVHFRNQFLRTSKCDKNLF